ncbi:hypothetical protein DFH09DRAFT_1089038 [Mycena vulgaris]|nr:hypothetical protein DFH09DRAFT_1089038 [Mycena vulgaris]
MYQNTRSYTLYAPKENGIESVIAKEEQNQISLVNASGRAHGGKGQIWTHQRAARREIGIEWRREDGYARGSGIRTVPEGGQSEWGGRSERVKGGGRDAYGETAGLIPAGSALRVREREDFGGETSSLFNRESHRPDIRNTRRGMRAAGSRSMSGNCDYDKWQLLPCLGRGERGGDVGNGIGQRKYTAWGSALANERTTRREGIVLECSEDLRSAEFKHTSAVHDAYSFRARQSRPRGDLRRRTYMDWLEDEVEWDGNASEAEEDERKEEREKGRDHACKWRGGMKRARQQGRDGIAPQLGGIRPACAPSHPRAPEGGKRWGKEEEGKAKKRRTSYVPAARAGQRGPGRARARPLGGGARTAGGSTRRAGGLRAGAARHRFACAQNAQVRNLPMAVRASASEREKEESGAPTGRGLSPSPAGGRSEVPCRNARGHSSSVEVLTDQARRARAGAWPACSGAARGRCGWVAAPGRDEEVVAGGESGVRAPGGWRWAATEVTGASRNFTLSNIPRSRACLFHPPPRTPLCCPWHSPFVPDRIRIALASTICNWNWCHRHKTVLSSRTTAAASREAGSRIAPDEAAALCLLMFGPIFP